MGLESLALSIETPNLVEPLAVVALLTLSDLVMTFHLAVMGLMMLTFFICCFFSLSG